MTGTPFDDRMPLHLQIRAARLRANLSIARLAELTGVHKNWLQKFESEGTNITVENLRRIMTRLPNTQLVLQDGLILSSAAAEWDGIDTLLRKFVTTSEALAAQARTVADTMAAMATTAADLAELSREMRELWDHCRGSNIPTPPLQAPGSADDTPLYDEPSGPSFRILFPPVMVLTVQSLENLRPDGDEGG